jgi:hypothetical protein
MWQSAVLPWIEAFLALIGLTAVLSLQPIAVPLFALVVFLFAYFGIPEVKQFVGTHPNTVYAIGGVTFLGPWGVRLGFWGILLTVIMIGIAAYITIREVLFVAST